VSRREFLTHEGRWPGTVASCAVALGLVEVLALTSLDGVLRTVGAVAAVVLVVPTVAAVTWPRTLWLDGDRLVLREYGATRWVHLWDVREVRHEWVPNSYGVLWIRTADDALDITFLDDSTEALRHEIGRRLPPGVDRFRRVDAKAARLLGWPD
jgi:hypothetical protein